MASFNDALAALIASIDTVQKDLATVQTNAEAMQAFAPVTPPPPPVDPPAQTKTAAVTVGRMTFDNSRPVTFLSGTGMYIGQSPATSRVSGANARYASYIYRPSDISGYTTIVHPSTVQANPSWILTSSKGQVSRTQGGDPMYLLDLGLPAVQAAAVTYLAGVCKVEKWNAIYLDELNYSFSNGMWNSRPTKYATDATWQAASASYLTALTQGLHAQGIKVYANFAHSTVDQTGAKTTQLLCDGAAQEDWLNWTNMNGTSGNGTPAVEWSEYWNWIAWVEAQPNFTPLYLIYNSSPDNARFALCFLLLNTGGHSVLVVNNGEGDSTPVNIPEFAQLAKLGQPTGPAVASTTGYTRSFQGGFVSVTKPAKGQAPAGLASITFS